MKQALITIGLLLTNTLTLAEENISSDFYFVVSGDDLKNLISETYSGETTGSLDDIEINEPYSTLAQDILLKGQYNYSLSAAGTSASSYKYVASVSDFGISIEKIVTDDSIFESLGSIGLNINIQGHCDRVQVSYSGPAIRVNGTVNIESLQGQLVAPSTISSMTIDSSQWVITAESCVGPANYEEEVTSAIQSLLTDEEQLKPLLEEELNNLVSQQVKNVVDSLLQPIEIPLLDRDTLVLEPESIYIDDAGRGAKVKGLIASVSMNNIDESSRLPVNEKDVNYSQTGLLLPQKFLQPYITSLHANKKLDFNLGSQSIEALRDFQRSRFYQFFVFPDLMNYPKSANFELDGRVKVAPEVSYYTSKEGFSWFNYSTDVEIYINAPRDGEHIPFQRWDLPVEGLVWMGVFNQRLYFGLSNTRMDLVAYWKKSYLDVFDPNRSFGRSIFESEIKKYMNDYQSSVPLSTIPLTDMEELVPSGSRVSGESIYLDYKIQSTSSN